MKRRKTSRPWPVLAAPQEAAATAPVSLVQREIQEAKVALESLAELEAE